MAAGVDPAIREALGHLNAVPGVRSRQSCQGRTGGRRGHSEFAYVLFAEPLPLAVAEALAAGLGDLARVEDDAVHCRWSARNAEFAARLAEVAERLARSTASSRTERWEIPLATLSSRFRTHLRHGGRNQLLACLPCRELVPAHPPRTHAPTERCALLPLCPPGEPWLERLFTAFLAGERPPIDPRLVAAEGVTSILRRCLGGNFGTGCRARWLAFERHAVKAAVRHEPRQAVAAWRRAGGPLREPDYLLLPGRAAFVWATSS